MSVEDSEAAILTFLSSSPDATIDDTYPWATSNNFDHAKVVGAIKSLMVEQYVAAEDLKKTFYSLTEEGESVVANGSQEILVLKALNEAGKLSMGDLQSKVGKNVAKIGMGNCMKAKWIKKDGGDLVPLKKNDEVEDAVQKLLLDLKAADFKTDAISEKTAKDLKKRKFITLVTLKSHKVTRGPQYAPQRVKKAADLTKAMLDSGAWETTEFKPYNFLVLGEKVGGGYLHPLMKVRAEFRKILMEMGFQEMPTNKWVESSFWNFDTLFQPQSHPARDAHDTFFIKDPAETISVPEDYYERVKEMHEKGGAGSIGYRYDFKREEAFKNLLRTHTTAVSSQMLYQLAINLVVSNRPVTFPSTASSETRPWMRRICANFTRWKVG